MSIFKILSYFIILLFLGACATSLENSRQYLLEGKKESAYESLIEHARENSVETLSYREEGTGIDFLNLLSQMNSPALIHEVYDLKFTELSLVKNHFIFSGRFSKSILELAQKMGMNDLQNKIADKVEQEITQAENHRYDSQVIQFAKFAVIYKSAKGQSHPNLSAYWSAFHHEKNLSEFQDVWEKSRGNETQSIHNVLKHNLQTRLKENHEQIIKLGEKKELIFIFDVENEYRQKTEFDKLRTSMKTSVSKGKVTEKIAVDEITMLKPQILKSSDRLFKLETERRDLQLRNNYTYEERVQCTICTGRGEVTCGTCRGQGVCRYCDRGRVDCNRCFHRGFLDCNRCWGRGHYNECQRVWDRGKNCYVERQVRVRCFTCFGSGHIDCGCFHGRVTCGRCGGHFTCRTCNGRRVVDCITCQNGYITEIRKTNAGKEIDARIGAAQTEQTALLNRLNHLEWIVRRETSKRNIFLQFL